LQNDTLRGTVGIRPQDSQWYPPRLGSWARGGVAQITEEQVRKCCGQHINGDWGCAKRPTYMGIDWGPANSTDSFTVVTILSVDEHFKPVVHFMKRFVGIEANFEKLHDLIPKLAHMWNVRLVGADRGMGEASNAELARRMGKNKIWEFLHSTTLKQAVPKWNDKGKFYTTNRNTEIGELFNRIRRGLIVLPKYESIEEPYVMDMFAITADFDEKHNKMAYVNSDPDDTMHSIIFGLLAARIGGAFESTYIY